MSAPPFFFLPYAKNLALPLALVAAALPGHGAEPGGVPAIPRLPRAPRLEDFAGLRPPADLSGRMLRITGFTQREPRDGQPATRRTEVYLGFDEERLYAVFAAYDERPEAIRARLAPREQVDGDDVVGLMLDTFLDRRRAYTFVANPLGVQWDATWSEGGGFDETFDTVWRSRGAVVEGGYVVLISVPFKSLRFPSEPEQRWGVILLREVPRGQAEQSFWPAVSSRVEGRLSQAAVLRLPGRISPSRNVQLIPYATSRWFRLLDESDPAGRSFIADSEPDAGLDAKLVVDDSLVVDVTANPDFSQVESDEPQVTVNRRFEVFFPERRPFFLENASLFETPLDLVFTRRIADPRLGVRLSGKRGRYALGGLVIDDQAPGELAPPGSPIAGSAARFAIARVSRDLGDQSSLGALYTERTLGGDVNRVAGVDARVKLGENWVTAGQAVTSWTRDPSGERAGPGYQLQLRRSGRRLDYSGRYTDVGDDFHTEAGFVPRTGLRETSHFLAYMFRPEGRHLISWGPELFVQRNWDRDGGRLDELLEASLEWSFTGQTAVELNYRRSRERLRPRDAPGLDGDADFAMSTWVLEYQTSFMDELEIEGELGWGRRINVAPPAGGRPALADWLESDVELTLRPLTRLLLDVRHLYTRLSDPGGRGRILADQIARVRLGWQFTRALSLRAILQYESTRSEAELTAEPARRMLNADFLLTYRVNPWTAVFVGYNDNARDDARSDLRSGLQPTRTGRLRRDARQLFVKVSFLKRF